jgi:hypothetical protein
MFTWINKQGVRSNQGFDVQFTGRFDAEYREGNRTVRLYVQDGVTGGLDSIIVTPDAFASWSDGASIPAEKQSEMFKNLRDAMEFQGLKLVVSQGEAPRE